MMIQPLYRMLLLGLCICCSEMCLADDEDGEAGVVGVHSWFNSVYLQSGYGTHWTNDEDYTGKPFLVGIEVSSDDKQVVGVSLFENSFSQFSQYYYYGYKWRLPFISESVQFKLTGGVIHGYVDDYEDKLAYNLNGWSPVLIPSLGWKRDRLGVDLAILGGAGVMLLVGYDIRNR